MATIGGMGTKEDKSLKITCDVNKNLVTNDDIKIDSPFKDKIKAINIRSCAGEVVEIDITYYRDDFAERLKQGEDPTWTETYVIDRLKLELQSCRRICYADFVQEYSEKDRDKILGVKTETPT